MKSINVGLIGAGTVGTGVYKILKDNIGLIKKRRQFNVKIKKISDIAPNRKRSVKIPA